jgi:hypothetical protein
MFHLTFKEHTGTDITSLTLRMAFPADINADGPARREYVDVHLDALDLAALLADGSGRSTPDHHQAVPNRPTGRDRCDLRNGRHHRRNGVRDGVGAVGLSPDPSWSARNGLLCPDVNRGSISAADGAERIVITVTAHRFPPYRPARDL